MWPSLPKAPRRQEHTRWSNIASPFPSTSPQQFRGASLTRRCKVMSRGYGSLHLSFSSSYSRTSSHNNIRSHLHAFREGAVRNLSLGSLQTPPPPLKSSSNRTQQQHSTVEN